MTRFPASGRILALLRHLHSGFEDRLHLGDLWIRDADERYDTNLSESPLTPITAIDIVRGEVSHGQECIIGIESNPVSKGE